MIVVIRSVGERTVPLIREMYPDAVMVENVTPFSEALRVSFETAIDSGAEQLVCIDGDVIPDAGMAEDLAAILQRHPYTYAIAPRMHDYLTGDTRTVGVHAYNVRYLSEALQALDDTKRLARPESKIRHIMRGKRIKPNHVYGVHGKRQYYRDIYRTVLLWPHKHAKHEAAFRQYWSLSDNDDFRVALRSWADGKQRHVTTCDASIQFDIDEILDDLKLTEKEPLCV